MTALDALRSLDRYLIGRIYYFDTRAAVNDKWIDGKNYGHQMAFRKARARVLRDIKKIKKLEKSKQQD